MAWGEPKMSESRMSTRAIYHASGIGTRMLAARFALPLARLRSVAGPLAAALLVAGGIVVALVAWALG